MALSRRERLQEFFRRLAKSPRASTYQDARKQVNDTLNAVEDEMSGVPYNATTWLTDGRMYPVLDDNVRDASSGVKRLRSRDHNIYIGTNGAIRVVQISTNYVLLDKPGHDGQLVPRGPS